jgi:hypothetical protein
MNQEAETTTASSRYHQLQSFRSPFVDRADKCAKLTIPTLFQKDVTSAGSMKIKDPEQSSGARGTNALASKMLLSLLPMNTPFFKLNTDVIDPELNSDEELRNEVLKGLGMIERQALRDIENSGDTTLVFEACKHLLVTGNCLFYVGEKASRTYNLNKYVVMRDPDGDWREIVICEEVSTFALSDTMREKITAAGKWPDSPEKTLKMYTHVTREDGYVLWHQTVADIIDEETNSKVPEDASPWIPLRMFVVEGEDYGRSYVEMYLGDLNSLEVLTKAVNDASAAAAKVLFLVRPNGTTNPQVLAKAPNLSIRSGDANDVTVLRMDKQGDLRVAQDMITVIERRLAYAFLINAEVMRDAERVTAEEVRFVAQELDSSLGGIYSLLSKEFQLPYVRRRLHLLRKNQRIPKLPASVKPVIVTGFAALGRGHDADKLMRFLEKVAQATANPALGQYININELIARFAVADGIETNGLLVPAQAQAQNAEQQQGMGMIDKLGPELIKQAGPLIQQQLQGATDGSQEASPG